MNIFRDLCFYTFMGAVAMAIACATLYTVDYLSDKAADDKTTLQLITLIGAAKGE